MDTVTRGQVQGVKSRCYDPNLSYMDRVVLEIVETERMYAKDLGEIISVRFIFNFIFDEHLCNLSLNSSTVNLFVINNV